MYCIVAAASVTGARLESSSLRVQLQPLPTTWQRRTCKSYSHSATRTNGASTTRRGYALAPCLCLALKARTATIRRASAPMTKTKRKNLRPMSKSTPLRLGSPSTFSATSLRTMGTRTRQMTSARPGRMPLMMSARTLAQSEPPCLRTLSHLVRTSLSFLVCSSTVAACLCLAPAGDARASCGEQADTKLAASRATPGQSPRSRQKDMPTETGAASVTERKKQRSCTQTCATRR